MRCAQFCMRNLLQKDGNSGRKGTLAKNLRETKTFCQKRLQCAARFDIIFKPLGVGF